ncbi:MAG: FliH/SctL family protein [Candidatus Saganbacteria bacterium]|nr:FliH/SctL family protein [Candidatus Saganbacteria bacterium]
MGVIKKGQLEEKGTLYLEEGKVRVSHARPSEVRIEKEEIPFLGPVQEKAHQIIAAAREQAERIKEEARTAGEEEGIEIGKREGMSEISEKLEESLETLNEAVKERKNIIKDSEAEILRLALKVSEQIIKSEVSLHRDVCLNMVSEAIARVSDREQIIVRVNREDVDTIKKYKDRIASLVDGVRSLNILEDSAIEPGGCIIETNLGYIDARISTKLRAIEDAFKKVVAEEETPKE